METSTKINLVYSSTVKGFDFTSILDIFDSVELICADLNETNINQLTHNSIIFLEFSEYNQVKNFLNEKNNFFLVIYDPYEQLFSENIPSYIFDVINKEPSQKKLAFITNKAYTALKTKIELNNLSTKYDIQSKELHTINSIGISLSTERDVDKLLETILIKCREITESDSGSLYLVSEKEGVQADPKDYFSNKELIFKLSQNSTIDVDFTEMVLELNKKSIAGYVALTGKPLNLKDAYNLPENSEYKFNSSFDESVGYRCKTMLLVPMKNQKDEIIGVIQLINKKKDYEMKLKSREIVEHEVVEYDANDQELVYSLASQAAILIDNTKLYHSIKDLFEGFIKASVTAIEARDPTTSGHSERVADFTVGLAEKVDSISEGKLRDIKFTKSDLQQIKYASLLHDFGKIGVKEDVLVKAKKLYPYELESITQRFKYIRKSLEYNLIKTKLDYLMNNQGKSSSSYFDEMDILYKTKISELDESLAIIISSNEPSVLVQEASDKLKLFNSLFYEDYDNSKIQYITAYELESLSILKGSLRESERKEIESHVTHTYEFLSKIPWTNEFKLVPEIAYSHHEKLDGTGYPRGVKSEDIPVPSKMMAISDIYDALTASDRPYKRALPTEKALDILGYEVKAKKLDEDLFKIFVEAKVYDIYKV